MSSGQFEWPVPGGSADDMRYHFVDGTLAVKRMDSAVKVVLALR